MARSGAEPASQQGVQIPLKWPEEMNLPTIYANQLAISYTGQDFYLVFGEAVPPTAVSDSEFAARGEGLLIRPVARVAVSHETMLKIVAAITNMPKFLKKMATDEAQTAEEGES